MTIHQLVQAQFIVGTACGIVILYMQVRAFARHRRRFFLTLAISTILALVSTIVAVYPYFVPTSNELSLYLYALSVPFGVVSLLLGAWGSVAFFIAFDRMRINGEAASE